MFKTYAPKGLQGQDLRGLLADLAASPCDAAKFLQVSERSLWRWLGDGSAPFSALAALWHETPHGRHVTALDVGNELVIVRGLAQSFEDQTARAHAQLCRVLAISSTGSANDPLVSGPFSQNTLTRLNVMPRVGNVPHLTPCAVPAAVVETSVKTPVAPVLVNVTW